MKSFLKKDWLFLGILLIQLFVLIFSFYFFKQGYHSDEIYEYGFSNSYDLRVPESDEFGNSLDRQWIDSKTLFNYITVDKDHRFSYSNIYKHASDDYYNPPLKLFVLHTICSFFPGLFSKWFSFSINIVSFIILQTFMYLLVKKLTNSVPASIASICLFGFGAGCFNAMMFLRMYIMGMSIGMVFLYYSFCYFMSENKKKKIIYLILVILSLFLGAFTLHLFLVYAFPLVFVICIFMLFLKRIKKFFSYGFSCLGAVLLSFLAFPQTFNDTMQEAEATTYAVVSYSRALQFRIYTYFVTLDIFGFHTNTYGNKWINILAAIFVFIIILLIPLFILFRKEDWFKSFLKNTWKKICIFIKDMHYSYVIILACLASTIFIIYICSIKTSVYMMSMMFASRYVFMSYPAICIFACLFVYYLIIFFIPSKNITSVLIVFLSLFIATYSQILSGHAYLLQHEEKGISLDKLEEDSNCYVMLYSNWLIVCFASEIYNTNSYYFLDYSRYENEFDCFDEIDQSKPLYIIMDCSNVLNKEQMKIVEDNPSSPFSAAYSSVLFLDDDILDHYKSLDCVADIEPVGEDMLFCRPIKIYRVYLK